MLNYHVSREVRNRLYEPIAPYPVSTRVAATELRLRNLDADYDRLTKLVALGKVTPTPNGDDWLWTEGDIDAAAEVLAAFGFYTPRGGLCEYLGLSGDVEAESRMTVCRENGVTTDDLVLTVIPGAVGAGVSAKIEYRPMSHFEQVERNARISAAQSV